jgi:hypothetical protein
MGDRVRSTSGAIKQGEFWGNLKRNNVVYVPVFLIRDMQDYLRRNRAFYRQTINTFANQTSSTKPVKAASAVKSSAVRISVRVYFSVTPIRRSSQKRLLRHSTIRRQMLKSKYLEKMRSLCISVVPPSVLDDGSYYKAKFLTAVAKHQIV